VTWGGGNSNPALTRGPGAHTVAVAGCDCGARLPASEEVDSMNGLMQEYADFSDVPLR